jgi:hypothetical protein
MGYNWKMRTDLEATGMSAEGFVIGLQIAKQHRALPSFNYVAHKC